MNQIIIPKRFSIYNFSYFSAFQIQHSAFEKTRKRLQEDKSLKQQLIKSYINFRCKIYFISYLNLSCIMKKNVQPYFKSFEVFKICLIIQGIFQTYIAFDYRTLPLCFILMQRTQKRDRLFIKKCSFWPISNFPKFLEHALYIFQHYR